MDQQDTNTEMLTQTMKSQITMYSIIVGLSILLVCVAPCVLFALLAKCFQSQSPKRRSSTLRSVLTAGIKFLDTKEAVSPLDSVGFGSYGPIQLPPSQLDCVDKIAGIKTKLPCTSMWKAYAPPIMLSDSEGSSTQRTIAIKKLNESDTGNKDGVIHSNCLRNELQLLSQLSPHHHLQNLLGVCLHNSNPAALIFEYCPYGCFHPYLLIKRRARLSQNSQQWAGLDYISEEPIAIKALDETERPCLSRLLDDYETRSRAFKIPLCEPFSEVDVLLLGLQIASVLDFLCTQGLPHKRLSTENILIGPGFYVKVMGMDFDAPMMHRSNSGGRVLRRTASGRNLLKWDAPEVLEKEQYSEKSEVWRFAMTLWEICMLGDTPFSDVPSRSLTDLVKKGMVPPHPEGSSSDMYSLMTSCWNVDVSDRPNFTSIMERINSMLKTHEFSSSLPRHEPTPSELQSFTSETDSAGLMGRLSPYSDQDSNTGSLHRRPSRRPFALPTLPASIKLPQGKVFVSRPLSNGHVPLLNDYSPVTVAGYLETEV